LHRSVAVPVLSPGISSLTVIGVIAYHSFAPILAAAHGIAPMIHIKPEHVLAFGTTLGAALQCVVLGAFAKERYNNSGSFRLSSLASLGSRRVRGSVKMLMHACMTSGVLQIAASTVGRCELTSVDP
jgi:peptidoglycan biosynthesis protein MviN/MurJ (putative lipid II flippase)